MQFSIVIATYNRRRLLDRAIASALGQSYPCEVVVVDDCSRDDTPEWVAQLQLSLPIERRAQLVYWRNSINQGHSASVNRGVELAKGDWVKLLDDDDYLDPNCIAEFVRAIRIHDQRCGKGLRPPAALCSCQALQVDLQGNEMGHTPRTGPGLAYFIPQEDIHYGMLVEMVPFGTPVQVAFRRSAFLQARGWDSQFDTNFDDIDAWIRIAEYGDAIFLNQCLAYRTVWDGAYNRQFSFDRRFDTNWSIKQKIHGLVNERFQQQLPESQAVQSYLRLHWGLVALKHYQWFKAFSIAAPSLLSARGWGLMLRTRLNRIFHALTWTYRDTQRYLKRRLQAWIRAQSPQSLLRGGWFKLRWQQMRFRLQLARQLWQQGFPLAALFVVKTVVMRWAIALWLDPLVRWAQRSPRRRAWLLRRAARLWRWLDRDLNFLNHLDHAQRRNSPRHFSAPRHPNYPRPLSDRIRNRIDRLSRLNRLSRLSYLPTSNPLLALPAAPISSPPQPQPQPQPPKPPMTPRLRQWIDRLRFVQARQLWHQGRWLKSLALSMPLLFSPAIWGLMWQRGGRAMRRPKVRRFVLLDLPATPGDRPHPHP